MTALLLALIPVAMISGAVIEALMQEKKNG